MVRSIDTFPHIDTGLLLIWESLPEEVATSCFEETIVRLDRKKLSDALANSIPPRNMIEIRTSVLVLLFNPLSRACRVLLFEPPVRIGDRYAVKDIDNRFGRRGRRNCGQLRHRELLVTASIDFRYILRVRLRRYPACAGLCGLTKRQASFATAQAKTAKKGDSESACLKSSPRPRAIQGWR